MPFALSNAKDYTLYLVYGTSSKVGVERMKDAMWKIDPVDGTAFKDPLDPNQLMLGFNEPDLTALKAGVVRALQTRGTQTVEELRWRFFPTMYKQSHLTAALKELRDSGKLEHDSGGSRLDAKVRVWLN